MTTPSIAFIGGGNMASSLLAGLLADGCPPKSIRVSEPDETKRQELAARFGVQSIPTLLLFKDGKQVKQMIGVQSAAVLTDLLKTTAAS